MVDGQGRSAARGRVGKASGGGELEVDRSSRQADRKAFFYPVKGRRYGCESSARQALRGAKGEERTWKAARDAREGRLAAIGLSEG